MSTLGLSFFPILNLSRKATIALMSIGSFQVLSHAVLCIEMVCQIEIYLLVNLLLL